MNTSYISIKYNQIIMIEFRSKHICIWCRGDQFGTCIDTHGEFIALKGIFHSHKHEHTHTMFFSKKKPQIKKFTYLETIFMFVIIRNFPNFY